MLSIYMTVNSFCKATGSNIVYDAPPVGHFSHVCKTSERLDGFKQTYSVPQNPVRANRLHDAFLFGERAGFELVE